MTGLPANNSGLDHFEPELLLHAELQALAQYNIREARVCEEMAKAVERGETEEAKGQYTWAYFAQFHKARARAWKAMEAEADEDEGPYDNPD